MESSLAPEVKKQRVEPASTVYTTAITQENRPPQQQEHSLGRTQEASGNASQKAAEDGPSTSEQETGLSEDKPSSFDLGIVAIEDKLHNGDQTGADIASRAADRAKIRGSSDDAVLDALEDAEHEYDTQQEEEGRTQPGTLNQKLSSRLEAQPSSPTVKPHGRNGSKGTVKIDDSNRGKIKDKLLSVLQKSPVLTALSSTELSRHAATLEQACHDTSSSRPVYFSKAGNISRLISKLSSQEELSELPRIASGLAKDVTVGVTQNIPPRSDPTGLQGVVPK